MKEPKGHRTLDLDDWDWSDDAAFCLADGEEWPCKTWRKWLASPEYRLGEIEKRLAANEKREGEARKELREAKEKLRRLELLVRGGVMLYLLDSGARISESVQMDYHDINTLGGRVLRTAGMQEYTVTYHGKNRRYVNGRLEEETFG